MKKVTLRAAAFMSVLTFGILAQAQNKSADLTYRYSSGKPVKYINLTKMHEVMDVNGQPMDVNVSGIFGFALQSSGSAGNVVNIEIKVDTLAEFVDSPQGMMGGVVGDIKGKSFRIALKTNGEVADLSEAKIISYTIPGQGPNNMGSIFADLFPVLPGNKVTTGYNWNSVDTVSTEAGVSSMVTITRSQNKVDGFEQVSGINCAKITSATEGTSVMNNEIQGMKMSTKGAFTGTVVTWFDTETGSLIKSEGISKMTGQMDMPAEGYSFPVVIDITETIEIRK